MHERSEWQLSIADDLEYLNFAAFAGCNLGVFQCREWPAQLFATPTKSDDVELLKHQWERWWQALLTHRALEKRGEAPRVSPQQYVSPDFRGLNMQELSEYLETQWPLFHGWWEMVVGGKVALAYYSVRAANYAMKYKDVLAERQVKLHLDLVFAGPVVETKLSDTHLVICDPLVLLRKKWWDSLVQV